MKAYAALVATLLLCCASGSVLANQLTKNSFQQNVELSDLVAICTTMDDSAVVRTRPDGFAPAVVTIRIEALLKGEQVETARVISRGADIEGRLNCCKKGERYLMLLRRVDSDYFESVNGRYGVVAIPR